MNEKVGPLKKLEKDPRFHKAFMHFGEDWNLKYHMLKLLELFYCLMYGQNGEFSVNVVRAELLCKTVGEVVKLTSNS